MKIINGRFNVLGFDKKHKERYWVNIQVEMLNGKIMLLKGEVKED